MAQELNQGQEAIVVIPHVLVAIHTLKIALVRRAFLKKKRLTHIHIGLRYLVEGSWSGWGSWGSCSTSCGYGTLTRSRGYSGGQPCSGSSVSTTSCGTTSRCPACKLDWSCCTPSSPCQHGEGDCDSDSDCAGKMIR